MLAELLQGEHIFSGIIYISDSYALIIDGQPYEVCIPDNQYDICILQKLEKAPINVYFIKNQEVNIEINKIKDISENETYINNFVIRNRKNNSIIFRAGLEEWNNYTHITFYYDNK